MNVMLARRHLVSRLPFQLAIVALALCSLLAGAVALAAPAFVQQANAVPQSAQSTVSVTFAAAQTAGDLNVVVIGWNDTAAAVQSVTDSSGNVYVPAVGPTALSGNATQSIYYAPNIVAAAANGNKVTVTFNSAAQFVDVRVAEYSGLATSSPVDVVSGATGSGSTANSGSVTSTNANDLIVAGNMVQTRTSGAGTSFTSRVITSPDGDILEDRTVTATGSYSATAALATSGWWVMDMVAFRAAGSGGSDTQPPTAPSGLTAAAASGTQINLSWTASTDNVGVTNYLIESCQNAGCSTFTQIATSTGTTFNNTGLTAGTNYSYRVRATDAAGNLSSYSNVASATTQSSDTQPPTAPSGLTATAASGTQINLGWTASTDNVGVTNYLVERCQGASCTTFTQIATSTTTSYQNTGLSGATSYTYRVRATDAAGNLSSYSATATAVTQAAATISFVQQASAVPQSAQSTVTAAYTAAQTAGDLNVVIVGWNDTTATVQSVTDTKGNTYALAVGPTVLSGNATQSIYYAANIAAAAAGGNTVTVKFSTAAQFVDVRVAEYSGIATTTPVDVTVGATGSGATANSGSVTTSNANDLIVAGNIVQTRTSGAGTGFTSRVITNPDGDILEDRTVTATGSYSATAALGSSGWWLMDMVAFRAGSAGGGGDTQPPTAPGSLTATANSAAQITLGWTASTDNVGVTGYLIERCQGSGCTSFAQIATSTTPSYVDSGLSASTSYSYRVRATDAAGNLSTYSGTASATTSSGSGGDTQPPTAPTVLSATALSSTQVSLSWTAATDNVGVTGYLIESCKGTGCSNFAQIATVTGTTFRNDVGLTASTTYNYRVRATDAAGNLGPYSNIATATTLAPDTQPPTTPSGLSATVISSTQINLSWTASTDNVGVTGYLVESCAGAGCTNFVQVANSSVTSFNNGGLSASTSYSYRVRATDAAGNLSGYSNVVSATTSGGGPAPAFVQVASATPQSSQKTVTATFATAQAAGDLNLVVVGWNDATAQIASVTDTNGNAYNLVAGPTQVPNTATQAIYYAVKIGAAAAGANKVTVTFNTAAAFVDLRIAEYSGINPADPIDTASEATGNDANSSSGVVMTQNTADLLVGANLVQTGTLGPGTQFTTRVITTPDADILEDRYVTSTGPYSASAPMSQSGWWIMQMVAFKSANTVPPDTTPPTVAVTAPAAGASVSGTVTLTASASDNTAVAGVQFQVDGVNVGPALTTSPYTYAFDTSQFANGTHVITAYSWDTAGNIGKSAAITVTFSNASAGNPAATGYWSGTFSWPLVAINSNLMYTGSILVWDGQSFGGFDAKVWNPVTSTFVDVPSTDNIFCSGNSQLPDGRILVTGGHVDAHVGINAANIFDPRTLTWTPAPPMNFARWYPTNTLLPNGTTIVSSGETNCDGCDVAVPEIYNATTNSWTQLTSAPLTTPYYPYNFVLPDGRMLTAGTVEDPIASKVLNFTNNTWSAVAPGTFDGGSAIQYLPNKILKTGTSANADAPPPASASTAYVLDMTQATPAWQQVQSMHFARTYHTLTSLPDGNVLVTGGDTTALPKDIANAVYPAELWSPVSQTWTTLASMHAPRLYHSTALLLPDARVLITGGGRWDGTPMPTDQLSAEIFAPPYLFKGARPSITIAPASLTYGQAFTVTTPDAASIGSAVLITLGSVTHTDNMSQRFVPLSFTAGTGTLTVTAPANANQAPPGFYMLFILNTNGVPSVAKMVQF